MSHPELREMPPLELTQCKGSYPFRSDLQLITTDHVDHASPWVHPGLLLRVVGHPVVQDVLVAVLPRPQVCTV
jgi:hypothetical protein